MNNSPTLLKEAERLYKRGFAIHWLNKKSKRPIESAWTTGPRKEWDYLRETYIEGLNLGVRLGTPSIVDAKGYLMVIDVDIKSSDPEDRKEALGALSDLMCGREAPTVLSGRGGGSRHLYALSDKPFKGFDLVRSPKIVKVHMPSASPNKIESKNLTPSEIESGLRLRAAWEISIMSDGRQVVLPPSIHPDSGELYTWAKDYELKTWPRFKAEELLKLQPESAAPKDKTSSAIQNVNVEDFEVIPVELDWLNISDEVRDAIVTGKGVDDRSAYMLRAASALLSAGLKKNEILSVLTDPETFLGKCGYDHAKTRNRKRAAQWVLKYSLQKVLNEKDASAHFMKHAKITQHKVLTHEEGLAQEKEFDEAEESTWTNRLERTDKGKVRNTFYNCKLMLQKECEQENFVGRNDFAANDFYLCDVPWGSKKGQALTDIDIIRIKDYFSSRWGTEFGDNTINQALMAIADLNRFHPVREWIKTLKWDGIARIDHWLKIHAGAVGPQEYIEAVSRKTLVAMVKRVFEPGCKFDHVLILEGIQGAGKSSLLNALAGEWFSDATLNIGDKDAVLTMQSKWLIELGELSALSRSELQAVKAFITQRVDRIRSPYGKRVEEFPRQSILVGSTNEDDYLRDLTGNRRFWPIKCELKKIKFDELEKERAQLFAEAYFAYEMGETLYLDDDNLQEQATAQQDARLTYDDWTPIVRDIVTQKDFPNDFELRDLAKRMPSVGADKMAPNDMFRLGRCLKLLGFEKRKNGGKNDIGKRLITWHKI